jgi:Na+/proline symporter
MKTITLWVLVLGAVPLALYPRFASEAVHLLAAVPAHDGPVKTLSLGIALALLGLAYPAVLFGSVIFALRKRKKKSDRTALVLGFVPILYVFAVAMLYHLFLSSVAEEYDVKKRPNQALQHNDHSCHELCLRTPRASCGRG